MNITEFANQLLDDQNELSFLRRRVHDLEVQVAMYQDHVQDELAFHERNFANLFAIALDPDNNIRKVFKN